jgi:threonine/homoserine efflux transporter RhtA
MTTAALIVVPIGIHDAGSTLLAPSLMALGAMAAIFSSSIPYSLEMLALSREDETMHVAAIGATGSGKSTALRGLMADP